jgi:hypothetical protein
MAEIQAAGGQRVALSSTAEYPTYPPASQQVCWAVTSLKAPFYEPTARAPVDIVAVIDKSGSMRGGKLDLVKKTLLFVVDQRECIDRKNSGSTLDLNTNFTSLRFFSLIFCTWC